MSVRGPKWGMTRAPWAGVSPPPHAPRAFGVPGGSFWAAGAPRVRPCGGVGRCNMHLLRTIATCVRRPRAGHNLSTVRGRFAPPAPPPRHQCTCGVPLGHWGAPGAAMRGRGQVQHAPALNLLPCDVPFHAASRHPVARRVGGAPAAGGWELSFLGATDVNFRAAAARAVAFLSHMPPALNLLSPWTFRC